jgi:hypothetical protein
MSFKSRVLKLEELYKPKQMHIKIIDTTEGYKAKWGEPIAKNSTHSNIEKGRF